MSEPVVQWEGLGQRCLDAVSAGKAQKMQDVSVGRAAAALALAAEELSRVARIADLRTKIANADEQLERMRQELKIYEETIDASSD